MKSTQASTSLQVRAGIGAAACFPLLFYAQSQTVLSDLLLEPSRSPKYSPGLVAETSVLLRVYLESSLSPAEPQAVSYASLS